MLFRSNILNSASKVVYEDSHDSATQNEIQFIKEVHLEIGDFSNHLQATGFTVNLEISWPNSVFGRNGSSQLVNSIWQKEQVLATCEKTLTRTRKELEVLEKKLKKSEDKVALIQSSKVWRAAETLRRLIYLKILRKKFASQSAPSAIELLNQPNEIGRAHV